MRHLILSLVALALAGAAEPSSFTPDGTVVTVATVIISAALVAGAFKNRVETLETIAKDKVDKAEFGQFEARMDERHEANSQRLDALLDRHDQVMDELLLLRKAVLENK